MNADNKNSIGLATDGQSPLGEKVSRLKDLFPELFSDGALDIKALETLLSDKGSSVVDSTHFGLSWDGQKDSFRLLKNQSRGALLPVEEKSHSFPKAGNVVISGENLEVMKLIQKAYFGAFKVIYMDPPYNTGSGQDFVYIDSPDDTMAQYLKYKESLTDSASRSRPRPTHSRWLTMMFPRLFVARNLLAEDGVIFVSIDDHEVHFLRMIMDDIFGPENFVCTFVWEKRYAPAPDAKDIGYVHENILCYKRTESFHAGLLPMTEEQKARYENRDSDPRGPWKPADYTCRYSAEERPTLYYPITNPNTGKKVYPKKTRVWACSKEEHEKNVREKRIWWPPTATVPAKKSFLSEIKQGEMPTTLLTYEAAGHTDEAAKEMRRWFPDTKVTSKPTKLLSQLIRIAGVKSGDLVLDCFAGTGTMAESVMELNKNEKLGAAFVLIQIPELLDTDPSINMVELARKRAITCAESLGSGVRFFELDTSSFVQPSATIPTNDQELINQLNCQIDNIVPGRNELDLLFEIMLKNGIRLTEEVKTCTASGIRYYSLLDGRFLVCLEKKISEDFVRTVIGLNPQKMVCLDIAFEGNDQLKTNAKLEAMRHSVVFTSI